MSQKIKDLFSQLSPIHKRNLLRELSDEFDCEVNLVIKSQYGIASEISNVVPYLYNVRYFKSQI